MLLRGVLSASLIVIGLGSASLLAQEQQDGELEHYTIEQFRKTTN